ncbi:MAG: hypothetical protein AVDCRST_MAG89-1769, partial [uncultured Gemmatimonadetes bacterium]
EQDVDSARRGARGRVRHAFGSHASERGPEHRRYHPPVQRDPERPTDLRGSQCPGRRKGARRLHHRCPRRSRAGRQRRDGRSGIRGRARGGNPGARVVQGPGRGVGSRSGKCRHGAHPAL